MSQFAALIPPDVPPPEPPGMKVLAFIISSVMTVLLLAFIGFICVDFWTDFTNLPTSYDAAREKMIQDECGPFISDFLNLHFPGQYALMLGKDARPESYPLSEIEQSIAIQKLQNMLLETQSVSVEITSTWSVPQTGNAKPLLSYDRDLAAELCEQVESAARTSISPLDYRRVPEIIFTFYPSEVNINISESLSMPLLYVTLGKGMQRWEGSFGDGLATSLLNARLASGETVLSQIPKRED